MRALIIGGCGFIGSHLVDRLLAAQIEVRVLDAIPEKYRPQLDDVDYRFGELSNEFMTDESLHNVDVVFHLASKSVPSTSINNPIADIQDNLVPFLNLLNLMVKRKVKRIVFISSGGAVYGNPIMSPVPEDHSLHPISSYGIVKVAIENYLYSYSRLFDISPVILRPSNAYGPRQTHTGVQGVIGTLLNKILRNDSITVWGDGSIVRDYIYVDDLVELCYLTMIGDHEGAYNVGSGTGYSISEIIRLIQEVCGRTVPIKYEEPRSFDPGKIVLDISKAKKDFNWAPQIALTDGIQRQWTWMQQNVKKDTH